MSGCVVAGVYRTVGMAVTGATCNVVDVTHVLHQHGALAVWDFAAAAPHREIGEEQRTVVSAMTRHARVY